MAVASVTVNYTAGCTGCTQEYRYALSSGNINTATVTPYSGSSPIVITGLTTGNSYVFQMRNVCELISSDWTSAQTVTCDEVTVITPTATPTPTPTSTSTPTPTPTPTLSEPTATPTPTPTPTLNVVDPEDPTTYYYYALGNCNDMRYSYTASTITGFSAPIQIPGCGTLSEIGTLSLQNPATTSIILSNPLDPCGFGESYSGVTIGRSTTQLTEGTVYLVGDNCLSIIAVETQYVQNWSVNLNGITPIAGDNPCGACDPPFTGFTITGYSGVTCDTGENILAYTLFGSLVIGNVYGIQLYSGGTVLGDARCMTINDNLGPQLTITDPENDPLSGYQVTDTGPFVLGQPMFQGYDDCETCEGVEQKYMITGERCDTTGSVTIWSDTAPTVVSGDTISVSILGSLVCFEVTQANQFTSVVYTDLGYTIADTGCDCNGNSGGANVNVDNIVFAPMDTSSTSSECQGSMGQYYNENYIYDLELTFRDSSNNQVTPNQPVQYRINGGSWVSLTSITSAIATISTTLTYYDNSVCGGSQYRDTVEVKVGTITVDTYYAGL
jgi:hypothetical protein